MYDLWEWDRPKIDSIMEGEKMKFAPWVLSAILVGLLLLVITNKNQEISNLTVQLAKANQEIAKGNQEIAKASLPEATVDISFRQAMMGSGAVAVISNTSNENIPIAVSITRQSTGQSKKYDFVMNARSTKEVGHMEGWAFVSGDVIAVSQPNHKVKKTELR
jgi:hypothetical protein